MGILASILIIITAGFIIYNISDVVTLIPRLAGSLINVKENIHIEDSASIHRMRNTIFYIFIVPVGISAARLALYHSPHFLEMTSPGIICLVSIAATGVYILLRRLLIALLAATRDGKTIRRLAGVFPNYFIVAGTLAWISFLICSIFGAPEGIQAAVIYREVIIISCLMIIRQWQILSGNCNYLRTFLYLCALEIVPSAYVAAIMIFV